MLRLIVAKLELASVTLTLKLLDPALVGTPAIVPPEPNVNPTGRVPPNRDQVYGVPPPEADRAAA